MAPIRRASIKSWVLEGSVTERAQIFKMEDTHRSSDSDSGFKKLVERRANPPNEGDSTEPHYKIAPKPRVKSRLSPGHYAVPAYPSKPVIVISQDEQATEENSGKDDRKSTVEWGEMGQYEGPASIFSSGHYATAVLPPKPPKPRIIITQAEPKTEKNFEESDLQSTFERGKIEEYEEAASKFSPGQYTGTVASKLTNPTKPPKPRIIITQAEPKTEKNVEESDLQSTFERGKIEEYEEPASKFSPGQYTGTVASKLTNPPKPPKPRIIITQEEQETEGNDDESDERMPIERGKNGPASNYASGHYVVPTKPSNPPKTPKPRIIITREEPETEENADDEANATIFLEPAHSDNLSTSMPNLGGHATVVKRETTGRRFKVLSDKSGDEFWSARMDEWRQDLLQCDDLDSTSIRWKSVAGALDGRESEGKCEEIKKEILRDSDANLVSGARKILWRHTPQVIDSQVLVGMSDDRKNFQESIFEVLTSQATYMHHMFIFENCFMKNMELCVPDIISRRTYDSIFEKIQPIICSSSIFYAALLQLWRTDVFLTGLCSVIEPYYRRYRHVYLSYARDIQCIVDDLEDEMKRNAKFNKAVAVFENFYKDDGQPLYSYINMPLQRITRLPLLFKNVLSNIQPGSLDYKKYSTTLALVDALAMDCNEECDKMRQCKIMLTLAKTFMFEFAEGVPPINILLSKRRLLLKSTVKRQKRMSWLRPTDHVELFLFNDLFLCAARPNIGKRLVVLDYCKRKDVFASLTDHSEITFYLVNNCIGQWATMTLAFNCAAERMQWKQQLELTMNKVLRCTKRITCPSTPPVSPGKLGYFQDFTI